MAAIWTLFIFSNSLRSASKSSAESTKVIEFLRPALEKLKIPQENWSHYIRKAAHFTEFFVIGLLLSAVFSGKRVLLPLVTGFIIAAVDETIQLFVPGRSGELLDTLIDTAGVVTSVLIIWGIASIRRQVRRKKQSN